MRKWILRALYVLPVLMIGGYVLADYTATQGTVAAFTCQSTKICPGVAIYDITGTNGAAVKAASVAPATTDPAVVTGIADGNLVTLGLKADAKSTATDTTSISIMQVLKQISASVQAPPTQPVTGTFFQTTQPVSLAASAAADGSDVTQGAKADAACGTSTGTCSLIALIKYLTSVGLPVTNTNANGRTTAANASPVVPVAAASTAGAIVPPNTTAVVVKGSAGTLFGVQVYGINAAPAYLKIYNATSATCGSGTPVKRIMIPAASTAANGAGSNVTFGPGLAMGTGITYCVTTGIADADTGTPTAANFLVNVDYE